MVFNINIIYIYKLIFIIRVTTSSINEEELKQKGLNIENNKKKQN